jgi:Concanavalin A-like lectin/glucanases superfamily
MTVRFSLVAALFLSSIPFGTLTAQAGTCVTAPADLVAWWSLDGNAADRTLLHSGTIPCGPGVFFPAEVGAGFAPALTGCAVTVPSAPDLNVTTFTIEAWVRVDGTSHAPMMILDKGRLDDGNASFEYFLYVTADSPDAGSDPSEGGKLGLDVGDGNFGQLLVGTVPLMDGQFHHVAATCDGLMLRLYVDGAQDGSAAQLVTPLANDDPVSVGGITGHPGYNVDGIVDEVALYSRALAPSEIAALFATGSAGKCPPSITSYGSGCVGSGGFVPQLSLTGSRTPGGRVDLQITQGLGGEATVLLLGLAPQTQTLGSGCTLLVAPLILLGPYWLDGTGAGAGSVSVNVMLPLTVAPGVIFLQAFLSDAPPYVLTSTHGIALSYL